MSDASQQEAFYTNVWENIEPPLRRSRPNGSLIGSVRCPHCYGSFRPRKFHLALILQECASSLNDGPLKLVELKVNGGERIVKINAVLEPMGRQRTGKILSVDSRSLDALLEEQRKDRLERLSERSRKALELIAAKQPIGGKAVAKALGWGEKRPQILSDMVTDGLIRATQRGYALPDYNPPPRITPKRKAVLAQLRQEEPMRASALGENAGVSKDVLSDMVKAGLIRSTKDGYVAV